MTQWNKIRNTLREFLGWHAIDETILTFVSFVDEIDKLRSSGGLDDETYNVFVATLTQAFGLAISEVVEANPYIQQLRKEIESRDNIATKTKRHWLDIVTELVAVSRRSDELTCQLRFLQNNCQHVSLPKRRPGEVYQDQCPDCGYIVSCFEV